MQAGHTKVNCRLIFADRSMLQKLGNNYFLPSSPSMPIQRDELRWQKRRRSNVALASHGAPGGD